METSIGLKIKEIRLQKNLTQAEFSSIIGVKQSNLSHIENAGTKITIDIIQKIISYFNISADWLMMNEGEMLRNQNIQETSRTHTEQQPQTAQNQHKDTKNISNEIIPVGYGEGIPLIPINAMAGYFAGEIQISSTDCDYYVVPMFKEAEFLIPVKGSSMIPKYNSGDIVACKRVPLDTFFQWNKVYVLDTEQGTLVKRIRKGEADDTLTIASDNPSYEPFPLHRSKIHAIAIVVGVIRQE